MSEVPLYRPAPPARVASPLQGLRTQGYLVHKKQPPPKTTMGPEVQGYCRVLGMDVFLGARYPCRTSPPRAISSSVFVLQGYLAHKKQHLHRTLQ